MPTTEEWTIEFLAYLKSNSKQYALCLPKHAKLPSALDVVVTSASKVVGLPLDRTRRDALHGLYCAIILFQTESPSREARSLNVQERYLHIRRHWNPPTQWRQIQLLLRHRRSGSRNHRWSVTDVTIYLFRRRGLQAIFKSAPAWTGIERRAPAPTPSATATRVGRHTPRLRLPVAIFCMRCDLNGPSAATHRAWARHGKKSRDTSWPTLPVYLNNCPRP
ncbi:hypothetical protein EVAR_103495_1 [Eumeta japonica]|uniref:Uncharacterized protein n=1 Tax=Eumeta variegata TaxID=151549 RepID=A0A4C1ZFQ7_EUMVA|nr:hypothetical protein EVAR_103495_1 [Eumeta japonica]